MKKTIRLRTEINIFIFILLMIIIIFQIYVCAYCGLLLYNQRNTVKEGFLVRFSDFVKGNIDKIDYVQNNILQVVELKDYIKGTETKMSYKKLSNLVYTIQQFNGDIIHSCAFDNNGNVLKISNNISDNELKEITSSYNVYNKRDNKDETEYYDFFNLSNQEKGDIYFIGFVPVYEHDFKTAKSVRIGTLCTFIQANSYMLYYEYDSIKNIVIEMYSDSRRVKCIDIGMKNNNIFSVILENQSIQFTSWKISGFVDYQVNYNGWGSVLIAFLMETVLIIFVILLLSFYLKKDMQKPIEQIKSYLNEFRISDVFKPLKIQGNREIVEISYEINGMIKRNKKLANSIVEKQGKLYEMEYQKSETMLYALQNQVNPHYMYNIFELIRSIAFVNGVKEIETISVNVAALLRYNLNKENLVFIKDEYAIIQRYVKIMDVKYKDLFYVKYNIDEEIMQTKIMKMIFQPIVENSFNHGFVRRKEKFCVEISAHKKDKKLYLKFFDNGLGINADILEQIKRRISDKNHMNGEKIGLVNLVHRLNLFYGNRYTFSIDSQEDKYTQIEITIDNIADV